MARPNATRTPGPFMYDCDSDEDGHDNDAWFNNPEKLPTRGTNIEVSMKQLIVLNVLAGNKRMPEEDGENDKTGSEPYEDPTQGEVQKRVITGFYGLKKIKNLGLTKERVERVCAEVGGVDKTMIMRLIHTIEGCKTCHVNKKNETGVRLSLEIDPASVRRMEDESQNYVLKFMTVDDSMSGDEKAVCYAIQRYVFGAGGTKPVSFKDSEDAAQEKLARLDRALAHVGERTEPASTSRAPNFSLPRRTWRSPMRLGSKTAASLPRRLPTPRSASDWNAPPRRWS